MGHFYYQDSLGNTSHVTDAVGNLLERYTYSAFGTPTFYNAAGAIIYNAAGISQSALGVRHLFQGQLWTQETGLNDYRNRVEFPTMGVFLQPDPIGFKGDAANIYRFCSNNAVNKIDPMGLDAWGNGDASQYQHPEDHTYSFHMTPNTSTKTFFGSAIGWWDKIEKGAYYPQCAAAARVLTGSFLRDGFHASPSADHWHRGPAVTSQTPIGTLVAKGWDAKGHYISKSNFDKDYKGNHAGVFLGFADKAHKTMLLVDQYQFNGGKGVKPIGISPVSSQGYARVDASVPYDEKRIDRVLSPPGGRDADPFIPDFDGGSSVSHPPIRRIGTQ